MAVNHPYTFGPSWKPAYISYSPDMIAPCKHSFEKLMERFVCNTVGELMEYPSGKSECPHCGLVKSDEWVHAWSLGLVE